MKKLLSAAVFTVMVAVYAQGVSGVPMHNTNPYSLGLEYHVSVDGHPMLYTFDSSSIVSHFARFHYAPCKFVRLTAGIGGATPMNNTHSVIGVTHKIDSKMGLSATGGVALTLPKLIPVLSITAGYDGSYIRYTEEETRIPLYMVSDDQQIALADSVEIFGKTTGKKHTPHIGLILHPNRFVDVEIGGMYKIFDIRKFRNYSYYVWDHTDPDNPTWMLHSTPVETGSDEPRFNDNKKIEEMRIYGSVTISEPRSKAYLNIGASAAPKAKEEYETGSWLTRSSFWVSAGTFIRDPRLQKNTKKEFSPSYVDLKRRQNEMAQELLRDIDREIEQAKDEEGEDNE